ncbi:DUF433 domain-containing protein [Leptospira interrogans]|uniref:DUF433 domain-containing protein n=2 Tax=Leptospira interrogans TaxID=173 RepID=UPI0002B995AB|nr:DUF433 domain-containing protein [Leptospira interrogans]UMQ57663.1 DUF433 domain-containing protein [Leptospira interrogans]UMQ57677.1 DUF433 domain-containing protein [Leptospira interrogans]UNE65045.1 DUF433 domain-containing protein [Leptospira interrogans]UNE65059.1 DUF433 domain-containing protein [Leptospira interrogans]UNE67122.1 DUF433 domain-containing protein [Leptospira interrogans]
MKGFHDYERISALEEGEEKGWTEAMKPSRIRDMDQDKLLERITYNPEIFGGKPIIRGRRLAVEHILGMLAAGDTAETILEGYPWLESEDIQACLVYAYRMIGHERIENIPKETSQVA